MVYDLLKRNLSDKKTLLHIVYRFDVPQAIDEGLSSS